MGKVKLVIRPWLAETLGARTPRPLALEEEIPPGATVGQVLRGLAAEHPGFGDAVFDAERQNLSGRISIVLNERLLGERRDLDHLLQDGDILMLLPTIEGG